MAREERFGHRPVNLREAHAIRSAWCNAAGVTKPSRSLGGKAWPGQNCLARLDVNVSSESDFFLGGRGRRVFLFFAGSPVRHGATCSALSPEVPLLAVCLFA